MQQRAAGGRHGRHLESTASVDGHLREEQSGQISFRSD